MAKCGSVRRQKCGSVLISRKDPQVRLPLMKPVQRIMVRTEVGGHGLATRRVIEHPAQRRPVHAATVHAETHDAPCPVVHHNEHPVRVKDGRFAPKQIHTPQAILRMTQDGQFHTPS